MKKHITYYKIISIIESAEVMRFLSLHKVEELNFLWLHCLT